MKVVTITGWRPGLEKVRLTNVIKIHTDVSLADAKQCTDNILAGLRVEFKPMESEGAEALWQEVDRLGAIAFVRDA
jgi:ribosomal protein L7/L12